MKLVIYSEKVAVANLMFTALYQTIFWIMTEKGIYIDSFILGIMYPLGLHSSNDIDLFTSDIFTIGHFIVICCAQIYFGELCIGFYA